MGQEYSTEDGVPGDSQETDSNSHSAQDAQNVDDGVDFNRLAGYRVMKVFQGSPASRCGLSPFEDFIVAVNGTIVESDKTTLANVLRDNEGKEVALVVWNAVDLKQRDVALRPVKWNGPGLLGAAVRYEGIEGATDHILRVINILPGSPAEEAGLVADTDYIVGTPAQVFNSDGDFTKLISDALDKNSVASLMVYSGASNRTVSPKAYLKHHFNIEAVINEFQRETWRFDRNVTGVARGPLGAN